MSKQALILTDIKANTQLTSEKLSVYSYLEDDKQCWLFTPLVVRYENETIVQAWQYKFNEENKIVSSQAFLWGEQKINLIEEANYIPPENNDHFNKVLRIMKEQSIYFNKKFAEMKAVDLLQDYSFEIILQNLNYRVRIRPLFQTKIVCDFFYKEEDQTIALNAHYGK